METITKIHYAHRFIRTKSRLLTVEKNPTNQKEFKFFGLDLIETHLCAVGLVISEDAR